MSTVETSVKVIPLGGLEQIGMNMTVFEYGESIIVVDCGMSFPGDEMLGIDMVIPDITYLKQNIHKVKGVFITHGHEDHIGALPFFFKEINVPLYGTKLTLGIIEGKLEEHGITKSVKRKVVKYGQTISAGDFKVEFIRTNTVLLISSTCHYFSGRNPLFILETLRSTIHLYLVIWQTYSALQSLERRAYWHFFAIVLMHCDRALQRLSVQLAIHSIQFSLSTETRESSLQHSHLM